MGFAEHSGKEVMGVPFGPDCQYKKFSDCTSANSDKKNPGGYCAKIKDATEDHCKHKAAPTRSTGQVRAVQLGRRR